MLQRRATGAGGARSNAQPNTPRTSSRWSPWQAGLGLVAKGALVDADVIVSAQMVLHDVVQVDADGWPLREDRRRESRGSGHRYHSRNKDCSYPSHPSLPFYGRTPCASAIVSQYRYI